MFTNWVTAGGNLIAMRPDKQLASLLGLTDAGTTLSEGYLLVNTSAAPGTGIVGQTMQFHGVADRYTVDDGDDHRHAVFDGDRGDDQSCRDRPVGRQPGRAGRRLHLRPREIGRLHAAGQSGLVGAGSRRHRADSLGRPLLRRRAARLCGSLQGGDPSSGRAAAAAGQPHRVREPRSQAAAEILVLPEGREGRHRHDRRRSRQQRHPGAFQHLQLEESAGLQRGGLGVRARHLLYLSVNTPISPSVAAAFVAQGFEIGVHVTTDCGDYTPSSLEANYAGDIAEFASRFPGLPAPRTNRTHCIVWSDYDTQPQVALAHGIRLDTNYYYWPGTWVNNVPGLFTGSGMPMRFAKADGTMIDVYQAATQMTDESGQTYPFNTDTLLDRALGAEGYYGAFVANMHTDQDDEVESSATVSSAQLRGVPIVSAQQMLEWLDGRNGSSFGSISWNGTNLSFTVVAGAGSNGLRTMLPASFGGRALTGLTRGGTPVSFSAETIKGVAYAVVQLGGRQLRGELRVGCDGAAHHRAVGDAELRIGGDQLVDRRAGELARRLRHQRRVALRVGDRLGLDDDARGVADRAEPGDHLLLSGDLGRFERQFAAPRRPPRALRQASRPRHRRTTVPARSGRRRRFQATASINDAAALELGLKWRALTDGFVTGVRFYKSASNTGVHTGRLWSGAGALLGDGDIRRRDGVRMAGGVVRPAGRGDGEHDLRRLLSHRYRLLLGRRRLLPDHRRDQRSAAGAGERRGRTERRLSTTAPVRSRATASTPPTTGSTSSSRPRWRPTPSPPTVSVGLAGERRHQRRRGRTDHRDVQRERERRDRQRHDLPAARPVERGRACDGDLQLGDQHRNAAAVRAAGELDASTARGWSAAVPASRIRPGNAHGGRFHLVVHDPIGRRSLTPPSRTSAAESLGAGVYVAQAGDGEVILTPVGRRGFSGAALPAGWSVTPWSRHGNGRRGERRITLDGARVSLDADHRRRCDAGVQGHVLGRSLRARRLRPDLQRDAVGDVQHRERRGAVRPHPRRHDADRHADSRQLARIAPRVSDRLGQRLGRVLHRRRAGRQPFDRHRDGDAADRLELPGRRRCSQRRLDADEPLRHVWNVHVARADRRRAR